MSQPDPLLALLAGFAHDFRIEDAAPADRQGAVSRTLDTLGAAMGAYPEDATRLSRALALRMAGGEQATVIGTARRVGIEMAAFANATASREAEMNDVYMSRAGAGAHPSDMVLPLLAVAEHEGANGPDFMAAVLVAYEIYMQMSDEISIEGFDQSALATIGVAAGAARLMALDQTAIGHAISIAATSNNPLNQARRDTLSMWKSAAAGQAGRAGIFASILAAAGLTGPARPFAGSSGWAKYVARGTATLSDVGRERLRISDSQIKPRASCQVTISSVLAAEAAAAQLAGDSTIAEVEVETYAFAHRSVGTGEHRWHPTTRESADHSIPYVVAAGLLDGKVGPRQFRPERIADPALQALIIKIKVVTAPEFTRLHEQASPEHHTRVTVRLADGRVVVGEAGGDKGDIARQPSDAELVAKFIQSSEDVLGRERAERAVDAVWQLPTLASVSSLPSLFAVDPE